MRISVIGLGYLGTTHAAALSSLGHDVVGFDINPTRIAALSDGKAPFYEPGLGDLLSTSIKSGKLSFQKSLGNWCRDIEVHFICVGTPMQESAGGSLDTRAVLSSISDLLPFLGENTLIVGRSTVPVGTSTEILSLLSSSRKRVRLAWNPEFLSEGTAISDALSPDRLVIGVSDLESDAQLRSVYEKLTDQGVPMLSMDIASSELVKLASNSFLALKISFINGIASVAENAGASTKLVAKAMGLDSRIGPEFLNNGLGFGGSCLPKDLLSLSAAANLCGSSNFSQLLTSVSHINQERIQRVLEILDMEFGQIWGKKVAILGASFKANTDDIRNSPGIVLAKLLSERGADVTIHDPVSLPQVKAQYPEFNCTEDLAGAVVASDTVIFATNWEEYRDFDPGKINQFPQNKLVVDTKQVIDSERWEQAGWTCIALGEKVRIAQSQ